MEQRGSCYCPMCRRELDGRLVVDQHVWLVRQCPEHGLVRTMVYAAPAYLAKALDRARSDSPTPRHTCLVTEVTERCDVGCATCSASSTMIGDERGGPQLIVSILTNAVAIGADVVALSGGEPLMRDDLWDIVDVLHRTVPKIVIITSGRNFESDPAILSMIAARADWLEIYLQFDSLRDDVLKALRIPAMTAQLRRKRLALAVATGAATTAVCVIPTDSSEHEVAELATFCRQAGAFGVTFQPLRQLGRHPSSNAVVGPMSTIDHIQGAALEALGVDVLPQPFTQQPFDMSVAFVSGTKVDFSDRFFTADHCGGFRVATSSYWDFTNYFAPFASSGRYYFHIGAGRSLNGHYFSAVQSQTKAFLRTNRHGFNGEAHGAAPAA